MPCPPRTTVTSCHFVRTRHHEIVVRDFESSICNALSKTLELFSFQASKYFKVDVNCKLGEVHHLILLPNATVLFFDGAALGIFISVVTGLSSPNQ